MTERLKWEYRIQTLGSTFKQAKDEELEALLNEWGEEGWEIIAVHNLESSSKSRLIAKRALGKTISHSRSWP
jgi:hypothetical protein